jgi:hypothetical protein
VRFTRWHGWLRDRRAGQRAHIDALCKEHDIEPVYLDKKESGAKANVEGRRVLIAPTSGVRTYFVALHEIGHCVVGVDKSQPIAPQEVDAWRWALDNAIEEPTQGVRRMIFKALWHYMLDGFKRPGVEEVSNADLFPPPGDPCWNFSAGLEDGPRLIYEAAKIAARTRSEGLDDFQIHELVEKERTKARTALRRARTAIATEQREVGPPRPATAGEWTVLVKDGTAHLLARDGYFGLAVGTGDTLCGAGGVARPAPASAHRCWSCEAKATAAHGVS